jgi:hypothetical protein
MILKILLTHNPVPYRGVDLSDEPKITYRSRFFRNPVKRRARLFPWAWWRPVGSSSAGFAHPLAPRPVPREVALAFIAAFPGSVPFFYLLFLLLARFLSGLFGHP